MIRLRLRGPQGYWGGGGGGAALKVKKTDTIFLERKGESFLKVGFYLLTCSLKYFANKTPIFTVQNVPKNAF